MLSRTADNLYWMARYVERAENMARILDVAHRMHQLPRDRGAPDGLEWEPALTISGQKPSYEKRYDEFATGHVIAFMALDPENPSSIYSTLHGARENARAERFVLPTEMFESINATWLEMQSLNYAKLVEWGFREFFEWVKERSHQFRGTTVGTMLQTDAFHFTRLGTFIERADNTARLLDVKYHVLMPDEDRLDEAVDYYQWGAVLRAMSAFKAYRMIYRDGIKPRQVIELLTLRKEFPRSLHHCFNEVLDLLETLAPNSEGTRLTGEMYSRLRYGKVQDITRRGLHRFLTDFINRNSMVSNEIAKTFYLTPESQGQSQSQGRK
ncbi:MAG: alpha-E domain-containing protein [Rhodospirillum sp.]|nr:alpha-E domain-containing protein [Rhodospirillum sp.]MCF8487930.1 alpha-E domain-containing protein [Rhodospirillum sp.]MCF8500669.1 alpha-E domain-containing protein [Rhodospirillum sp.]